MKEVKKFLLPTLGAVAVISLASCGMQHTGETNNGITKNADGTITVRVGNTNAAALLPTVFGPMDYGMRAQAYYYSHAENNGKVKIDYIHRDDGFVAAQRATNTAQLLDEDKVFGIVYSYADQANLLEQANKPEIYTPLTRDYYLEANGGLSFPIQPIDYVEGKQLLASAFAKGKAGLGATKVGVFAGNTQNGNDVVEGIRDEARVLGKTEDVDFFIQRGDNLATTDPTSAVQALKNAGVNVIIVSEATYTFGTLLSAIVAANWENVTVLATYKLSNALYFGTAYVLGFLANGRRLVTPGWIAAGVQNAETYDEWAKYAEVLTDYAKGNNLPLVTADETKVKEDGSVTLDTVAPEVVAELEGKYEWAKGGVSPYFYDSYAMAGYIGMHVFTDGIGRLFKENLLEVASTEDFINVMEKDGMHIPMSTVDVSLKDGARTGARAMTLVECTVANHSLGEPLRTFYDIPDLEKAAK